jgi:hypothetical protein
MSSYMPGLTIALRWLSVVAVVFACLHTAEGVIAESYLLEFDNWNLMSN